MLQRVRVFQGYDEGESSLEQTDTYNKFLNYLSTS